MKKECLKCKWLALCLPLGPEGMYETHKDVLRKVIERGGVLGPCCETLEKLWKKERGGDRGSEQRGGKEYR